MASDLADLHRCPHCGDRFRTVCMCDCDSCIREHNKLVRCAALEEAAAYNDKSAEVAEQYGFPDNARELRLAADGIRALGQKGQEPTNDAD